MGTAAAAIGSRHMRADADRESAVFFPDAGMGVILVGNRTSERYDHILFPHRLVE